MKREVLLVCAGLAVLCCVVTPVVAGPNAGGTLILHADPSLVYTADQQSWCGMTSLAACSLAVTNVPWQNGTPIVFHVLAAFPPASQPRLKGITFGVHYDSTKFFLMFHGKCADFEVADGTWPEPGSGTGLSWTTTQTDQLVEAYWFVGYAYSEQEEDSTTFAVIPHPTQGGLFVDDALPGVVDSVLAYGSLGFGIDGGLACPMGDGGTATPGGGRQVVHNPVPGEIAALDLLPVGRLPADRLLNLAIVLPVRDRHLLEEFVDDVSSPVSPHYRQYLTPDQFAERFSPTEREYGQLITFVELHHLAVTATFRSRLVLDVHGSAGDIERAFHVSLHEYNHPREDRNFFAPDVEPSVDLDISILGPKQACAGWRGTPRTEVFREAFVS